MLCIPTPHTFRSVRHGVNAPMVNNKHTKHMTKHTGGEWYVERIHKMKDNTPHDHDIWSVYSTQKARYVDAPQDICSFNWLTPAGKANAHLISAAPDLLQVAKDYVLLCQLHGMEGAVLDSALSAIAKAEGEA